MSAPGSPSSPGDLLAVERAITALEAQRAVLGDDIVETALPRCAPGATSSSPASWVSNAVSSPCSSPTLAASGGRI